MLWQIHNQFKDSKSEICAQRELNGLADLRKFIADTTKSYPLPDGATRMVCDDRSKHFMMMEDKTDG